MQILSRGAMIQQISHRVEGPEAGFASDRAAVTRPCGLSVSATNVLKELAVELVGEMPSKIGWEPSNELLCKLTARHLATARNCGPQTMREIIDWAEARGVSIQFPRYAGKSLSQVWGSLI